jgi:2,3-bisphosphoglycerate-dependent phosphoglycerate mutase
MLRIFCTFFLLFLFSCKSTTYFIVRHAEKESSGTMMMQSDPPLSSEGEKQALDLRNYLQNKAIKNIYSTNYARTIATAEPLRQALGINLKTYDPRKNEQLVEELKKISDGNVLVVGHSNTVDDVVNGLMGENKMTDLNESEYGNVFIVKRKGNSYSFERLKVPQTMPRTLP